MMWCEGSNEWATRGVFWFTDRKDMGVIKAAMCCVGLEQWDLGAGSKCSLGWA